MSGLVGDSHLKALEELISAFSVVKYAEESRLVVVTAQMGWGKTRVVQELYAHLASHQPSHSRYAGRHGNDVHVVGVVMPTPTEWHSFQCCRRQHWSADLQP